MHAVLALSSPRYPCTQFPHVLEIFAHGFLLNAAHTDTGVRMHTTEFTIEVAIPKICDEAPGADASPSREVTDTKVWCCMHIQKGVKGEERQENIADSVNCYLMRTAQRTSARP